MQYLDNVKLINDNDVYKKDGITKGDIGVIWLPEIRDNKFYVAFEKTLNNKITYKYSNIHIQDLELIESGECLDKDILDALPKNNPNWWCKVENGYIINLLGEKKNKTPYNYNS